MMVKISINQMEEKIWTTNPENQQMLLYMNVSGKTKIKAINELEYINGKFYANVWQKMPLQLIPKLELLGILDMSGLRKANQRNY
jgi:glutamine cyclotransferase